jgi:hypothetical protein
MLLLRVSRVLRQRDVRQRLDDRQEAKWHGRGELKFVQVVSISAVIAEEELVKAASELVPQPLGQEEWQRPEAEWGTPQLL